MDHNDIEMEDLSGEQYDLAECIGIEAYRTVVKYYGGSYIYIAKSDGTLKNKRDATIRREYDGCNVHDLSIKYNLSESTIRLIVAPERKRVANDPTTGQLCLGGEA